MRKEGDRHGLAAAFAGGLDDAGDDRLMAGVHPVEVSERHHG
jgi:hypothetical protein